MGTTAVKERPIIMSGPMVRAILEGTKTQTRRAVTGDPFWRRDPLPFTNAAGWWGIEGEDSRKCPFGAPGDALWVKESAYIAPPNFGPPSDANATDDKGRPRVVDYAASMDGESVRCAGEYGVRKTPSIHMPRWASRITLEIIGVRVESVQAISEADAVAEGVQGWTAGLDGRAYDAAEKQWCQWSKILDPAATVVTARGAFAALWDLINGKRPGCDWRSNPWVWAISFKRLDT